MDMNSCLAVSAKINDRDRDDLLQRVDSLIASGLPADQAQTMAANDLLAEIETERAEMMAAVQAQHPDLFETKAAPQNAAAESAEPAAAPYRSRFFSAGPQFSARRMASRTPLSTIRLMQMGDEEARSEVGLNPKPKRGDGNSTRQIGEALNRRTLTLAAPIADDDVSPESAMKLATAMAEEVRYQLGATNTTSTTGTGLGWYSHNYPRALTILARRFPELGTHRSARSVFTALVAVTSNGEKVTKNIANAIELYGAFRMGQPLVAMNNRRAVALEANLVEIEQLIERHGLDGFAEVLMRETTVAQLNRALRAMGKEADTSYEAATVVPEAAVYFGPKLGAFFANLMGSEGYLTMDLWWSRSINRMRGTLIPHATESSLQNLRQLMGREDLSRDQTAEASVTPALQYKSRNYVTALEALMGSKEPQKPAQKPGKKDAASVLAWSQKKGAYEAWIEESKARAGDSYEEMHREHRLEKAANTIYKNEYLMLEEAPFRASDRSFMYSAARNAQRLLRNSGTPLSLADIQAALWYYEKRLYQKLSGRKADDIGYEEALIAQASESAGRERPSTRFLGSGDFVDDTARSLPVEGEALGGRTQEGPGDGSAAGGEGGGLSYSLRAFNQRLRKVNPSSALDRDISIAARNYAQWEANRKPNEGGSLLIGPQPHVLHMLGLPMQGLVADAKVLEKIFLGKHAESHRNLRPHEVFRALYRPAMVTASSEGRRGEYEIVTSLLGANGKPLMLAVLPDAERPAGRATFIKSSHEIPLFGPGKTLEGLVAQGRLRYADLSQIESLLKAKSPDMPGSAASKEQRAQFRPLLGDIPSGGVNGIAAVAGRFRQDQKADLLQRQIKQQINVSTVKGYGDLVNWIAANYAGDASDMPQYSRRSALGLYSELEGKIAQGSNKAPAVAWKAYINGLTQKGVKPDEIEWSGVKDWLDLQQGVVSKEALLGYLQQGGVKVEETRLDDPRTLVGRLESALKPAKYGVEYDTYEASIMFFPEGKPSKLLEYGQLPAKVRKIVESVGGKNPQNSKYENVYELPGGTNYREVLLTLPTQPVTEAQARQILGAKPNAKLIQADLAYAASKNANEYRSKHWDQPNVLAHIRLNDRTDADGNKVLFVEEIQSDWGQDGKQYGFGDSQPVGKREIARIVFDGETYWAYDQNGEDLADAPAWMYDTEAEFREETESDLQEDAVKGVGIPKAPFVTKTEGWLNLALKRVMVLAAEGGYDKVAFINAAQAWERFPEKEDGTSTKGSFSAFYGEADGKVLDDKGRQVFDSKGNPAVPIVQTALKKLLPKVGGGQVGQVELGFSGDASNNKQMPWNTEAVRAIIQRGGEVYAVDRDLGGEQNISTEAELQEVLDQFTQGNEPQGFIYGDNGGAASQPGFDVTDAMRDKVDTTGLPMFSRRQTVNTPEFQRWFGDSKVVDENGEPLVVYHGTNADIEEFAGSDFVGWFAKEPGLAERYLRDASAFSAPNVMPVYLAIKNPLRLQTDMNDSRQAAIEELARFGFDTDTTAYGRGPSAYAVLADSHLAEQLFEKGYDGVFVKEDGVDTYAPIFAPQIKSAIGNNGEFDPINPDINYSRRQGSYGLRAFGLKDTLIEGVQDRYNRWQQATQDIRAQGGVVSEANDFYRAEERYWGRVGTRIDDFKVEVDDFIRDVADAGFKLEDVAIYAYAQHAQERNAWIAAKRASMPDGGSGMPNVKAQAYLDDAQQAGLAPELQRLTDRLRGWIQGTRDGLLADGLIDAAEHGAWTSMFQNYVPLRGLEGFTEGQRTGQGMNVRGPEGRQAFGRRSEAKQIIEQIIADRTRAYIRAGKNEVLRSFGQFVIDNPSPNLWEINAVESKPISTLDANGNRIIEERLTVIGDDRTVTFKDGGQEVHILVNDERLRTQLQNLHVENVGRGVGALLFANRIMSRLYTSLNPVFTVLNGARDAAAAGFGMIDEVGFLGAAKTYALLPKALYESYQAELGRYTPDYQLYRSTGGKTGFFDFKTLDAQTEELQKLLANAERSGADPRVFGPKLMRFIEALNGGIENATRLASFKAARSSGLSLAEAARVSKNITVNFNRKGTLTPQLSAWFLFFNPAVQGTARLMQALKSPKVLATLGVGMAGMFALALRNAGMGDDDDGVAWWDKVPDETKERNVIIMLPPGASSGEAVPGSKIGRYLKVPMPYGYNFFAVVANQAADYWRHSQDPKRGRGALEGAAKAVNAFMGAWIPVSELGTALTKDPKGLAMLATPDAFNPVMQNVINMNAFGGKMYPDDPQTRYLPDSAKYFAGQAGTLFQKTAEKLNTLTGGSRYEPGLIDMAPASVENLVRGYLGGPAGFTMDLLNASYARQSLERPTLEKQRLPFVKQLYGVIDAETDRMVGYERLDKAEAQVARIKQAQKDGDAASVAELLKENRDMVALGDQITTTREQLARLRKDELSIMNNAKLSDADKYSRLQMMNERRRRVLQQFNQSYDLSRLSTAKAAAAAASSPSAPASAGP